MSGKRVIVNAADSAIVTYRRELVARARLRGATLREIVVGLTQMGFINQKSGEPWSLATIHNDLKVIEADWRKEARKAIAKHKARQMAELAEVRRQAWHNNDMQSVLRAIGMEMDLMGTSAPKVTQVTGKDGGPVQVRDVTALSDDELERIAAGGSQRTTET